MGCLATISALGAVVTLAAGGDGDVLKIGTGPVFPPYLYQDAATGTLSGLDHAVAEEICARIKARCIWDMVEFEDLIPGVREGRFDFVLGGMAISTERRSLVDFTQAYTYGGGEDWFIGPTDGPAPQDARIAVISGTIQASWARAEGYDVFAYVNEAAALDAVVQGDADMVFGTMAGLVDLEQVIAQNGFDYLDSVVVPDDGVAIAVCKGNQPLLDRLNTAIIAMDEDGTLAALETRWQ